MREARILLDKEGNFQALQQEAQAWAWEPLQHAANEYASEIMMVQTEIVHKILRALSLHDQLALSEMILIILSAVTDAIAVQRGILAASGNSYFHQVQESVGTDAAWSRLHRFIAGIDAGETLENSIEAKGIAALDLYQESVCLLRPAFHPAYRDVIEQSVLVIKNALSRERDKGTLLSWK
jgi:hypothetical protein